MTLLELRNVGKSGNGGSRPRAVLREVCLKVQAGELVVVWGMRRSGRSTLLRVAAGIEAPDAGSVLFCGRDLKTHGERLIGDEIGYCHKGLRFTDGHTVLDHAMVGLLSRWIPLSAARKRARRALARVGAEHCAERGQGELSSAEAIRVALARTLVLEPRLIAIDEPVKGVDLIDRDGVLALLRSLANEGTAVLSTTGESTGLSEADRGLVLSDGELRGAPVGRLAPVVPLRRRTARRASL